MEPWELLAREAIRDTIARYAAFVDRGQFDALVALFTEDATLEAGDLPPAAGRDGIRALLQGVGTRLAAAEPQPYIRHHVSSLVIDVETPSAARATSYFLAVTARGLDHWGRYRDRLVAVGDRWLFQHRRVRTDGRAPGSVFAR